jgi:kynurenine formamidase
MPSWPTLPDLRYEAVKKAARDFYTINVVTQMHMHVGTHVDVPLHSIVGGKSIDQYPVDRYAGEGVVVDLRMKRPDEEISPEDLRAQGDVIRKGDVVMLCTDYHKRKGFNPEYLFGWPYLGPSACKFLIRKGIRAVGTEGMSIAGWTEEVPTQGPISKYSSVTIHNLLLERDIIIIEGLGDLSLVLGEKKSKRAYFVFAPMNFVGTEGAPCRAMAFLDDDEPKGKL